MRIITAGIFLFVALAAPAHSAVVTYTYQGKPLRYYDVEACKADAEENGSDSTCDDLSYPHEPFYGSVTFDTAHVPGASLAGSSIDFFAVEDYTLPDLWHMTYDFAGPGGDQHQAWDTDGSDVNFDKIPSLVGSSGWIFDALHPWLIDGRLLLTFNEFGDVSEWEFSRSEGGFWSDWGVSTYGDGFGSVVSEGPGTWSKSIQPSPVPLPSSFGLMAASVGLISLLKRSRQDRRIVA